MVEKADLVIHRRGRWWPEERWVLAVMRSQGRSCREIAQALYRTQYAVQAQVKYLELAPKNRPWTTVDRQRIQDAEYGSLRKVARELSRTYDSIVSARYRARKEEPCTSAEPSGRS